MKHPFLLLAAALGLPSLSLAQVPYVYVDVQFKVLVPSNPPATFSFLPSQLAAANTAADAFLRDTNRSMENSWRGLRYQRQGNVLFVTAADVGDGNGDNKNDIDFLYQQTGETREDWLARKPINTPADLAPSRPTAWKYSSTACNFYILSGWPGGVGYFDLNLVVQGGFNRDPGVHELAHWFGLRHPFSSTETNTPLPVGSLIQWGDDGFSDTLKDFHQGGHTLNSLSQTSYSKNYAEINAAQRTAMDTNFRNHYAKQFYNVNYASLNASQKSVIDAYRTRDQNSDDSFSARDAPLLRDLIANGNFGAPGSPVFYSALSAANKQRVDDLILNIASYHFGKGNTEFGIFSEQQSDQMCDRISYATVLTTHRTYARNSSSGKYLFFGGPILDPNLSSVGSSKRPINTPASAITAASAGDVLLGRPGAYPNPGGNSFTINKPLSIRATKAGEVRLGASN